MKNNHHIPAYDIDELVAAYPHQEFLQASAASAWQRLQHKKRRNRTVIPLQRLVAAAAIVLLMMAPCFLLNQGMVKPTGKMEEHFGVVQWQDDVTKQPATKGLNDPLIKTKVTPSPAVVKQQAIPPVPSPTGVNGLSDSAPTHPKDPLIQLAGFNIPDSIDLPAPATRKEKKIPPSINELFDGIQKLSNIKRVSGTGTADTWKTASPPSYPDTLFPKSYN